MQVSQVTPPQSVHCAEDKPTLVHFEVSNFANVQSRGPLGPKLHILGPKLPPLIRLHARRHLARLGTLV